MPDLPGHGRSDLAGPAAWTLDDWADDVAVVVDALQLDRPTVVGVSFGGWVVLRLMAVRQPGPALRAVRGAQIRTPRVNAHVTPQFGRLDLTGDARAVRCPVTVVAGERDPLTTSQLAAATVDAVLGPARLRLVADAAHDLLPDDPEVLLEEIDAALAARL